MLHNIVLHEKHVLESQAMFAGMARRFVMTSSMDVYRQFGLLPGKETGDPIPGETDEDSPVRSVLYPYRNADMPENHRLYHYDKIPAEKAALSHPELPGVVLRLPMVIGENEWQRRRLPFVQTMRDNRPAMVLDEAWARWYSTCGYVENVAQAMITAALDDRANGRVYNVADISLPTLTLAEKVKAMMNWPGEFVLAAADNLPEALRFGVAVPQDLKVKAERIRHELDFKPPVAFDDGVRRTVVWELANPPEQLPPGVGDYAAQDEVLEKLKA